jgi:PPOX class probable F420-dependent enzyme
VTAADERFRQLLDPSGRGVLVTLKRDGRPQVSTIDFCFDPVADLVRISTIDGSAKVANLRRDPRASLYVPSSRLATYTVAEGIAELSAVSQQRDDAVVEELIDVYRRVQGEHPDWDDYRRAMVEDRRLVIRLRVERFYGYLPAED